MASGGIRGGTQCSRVSFYCHEWHPGRYTAYLCPGWVSIVQVEGLGFCPSAPFNEPLLPQTTDEPPRATYGRNRAKTAQHFWRLGGWLPPSPPLERPAAPGRSHPPPPRRRPRRPHSGPRWDTPWTSAPSSSSAYAPITILSNRPESSEARGSRVWRIS